MIEFFSSCFIRVLIYSAWFIRLFIYFIKKLNREKDHMDFDMRMLKELDASILNESASIKIAPSELTTPPNHGSSIQPPARSLSASRPVRIPRFSNCPNCGAPAYGNHCEYCGTDFLCIDLGVH